MDLKTAQMIDQKFKTPCYIYEASALDHAIAAYKNAFSEDNVQICYAVKANNNPFLLRRIFAAGIGADIVSMGEGHWARKAPFIVFSGVAKTEEELTYALDSRVDIINVESMHELEFLAQQKQGCSIMLRVNPNIDARTHPKISTGMHENKFGITSGDLSDYLEFITAHPWIKLVGVGAHIGSQIFELDVLEESAKFLLNLSESIKDRFELRYLNLGGGLGVSYTEDESNDAFAKRIQLYAQRILALVRPSALRLIIEPGRSLVARSGKLLTRVVAVKKSGDKNFLLVNAGMNDFMRPALYGVEHRMSALLASSNTKHYEVVGPICESTDVFAKSVELPECAKGDFILIHDVGAYGYVLSHSYNARPRPGEVWLENGEIKLIRNRDNLDQVIAEAESLL